MHAGEGPGKGEAEAGEVATRPGLPGIPGATRNGERTHFPPGPTQGVQLESGLLAFSPGKSKCMLFILYFPVSLRLIDIPHGTCLRYTA